jgi:hypothetical protein
LAWDDGSSARAADGRQAAPKIRLVRIIGGPSPFDPVGKSGDRSGEAFGLAPEGATSTQQRSGVVEINSVM